MSISVKQIRKAKPVSANNLTRQIIALITAKGGFATRVNSQGQWDPVRKVMRKGTTVKGMTDIVGVLNGVPLFIEVKVGKDKLRPEQEAVAEKIKKAGGKWILARSLDDVIFEMPPVMRGFFLPL